MNVRNKILDYAKAKDVEPKLKGGGQSGHLVFWLTENMFPHPLANPSTDDAVVDLENNPYKDIRTLADQIMLSTPWTLEQAMILTHVVGFHPSPQMRESMQTHYDEPQYDPEDTDQLHSKCWKWRTRGPGFLVGRFAKYNTLPMVRFHPEGPGIPAVRAAFRSFRPQDFPKRTEMRTHQYYALADCELQQQCVNPWHKKLTTINVDTLASKRAVEICGSIDEYMFRQRVMTLAIENGAFFTAVSHVNSKNEDEIERGKTSGHFRNGIAPTIGHNSPKPPNYGLATGFSPLVPLAGKMWKNRRRCYSKYESCIGPKVGNRTTDLITSSVCFRDLDRNRLAKIDPSISAMEFINLVTASTQVPQLMWMQEDPLEKARFCLTPPFPLPLNDDDRRHLMQMANKSDEMPTTHGGMSKA